MPAVRRLLLSLLPALLLGIAAPALAGEEGGRTPKPDIPKAQRSAVPGAMQCVEPTQLMRERHYTFILHQRDATMHQGIRGARHSLADCVDCHVQKDAQGKPMPVNAPGQFCSTCHSYAAVQMDCFECHRTTPMPDKTAAKAETPGMQPLMSLHAMRQAPVTP
jgi:hypothetical protein